MREEVPELFEAVMAGDRSLAHAKREIAHYEKRRKATLLSDGICNLVYAYPPWAYGHSNVNGAARRHYGTMSNADLEDLQVANDAVQSLWLTNTLIDETIDLAAKRGGLVRNVHCLGQEQPTETRQRLLAARTA